MCAARALNTQALCRVATLKALPSDEEMAAGGFEHAGAMIHHLRESDPPSYKKLQAERCGQWGAPPPPGGLFVGQPLCRRVEQLLSLILHTIEVATRGEDDLMLTEKEVELFFGKKGIGGGGGGKEKG